MKDPKTNIINLLNLETGKRVSLDLGTPEGRAEYQLLSKSGYTKAGDTTLAKQTSANRIAIFTAEDGSVLEQIFDINSQDGKKVLAEVNKSNKARSGSAQVLKIPTESRAVVSLVLPGAGENGTGRMVLSNDGGRTYLDENGVLQRVPSNAIPVSSEKTYKIHQGQKIAAGAKRELDELLTSGMSHPLPGKKNEDTGVIERRSSPIDPTQQKLVTDSLANIRAGTGPWSAVGAAINGLLGGVIAPETFSEIFKDLEGGRQFVKLVRIFGRSALAASPRFAVEDLKQTEKLFPNETEFFSNPASEVKKMVLLVETLNREQIRLLTLRASADKGTVPQNVLAVAARKLQEIARLKEILGPILAGGVPAASTADVEGAVDLMKNLMPNRTK